VFVFCLELQGCKGNPPLGPSTLLLPKWVVFKTSNSGLVNNHVNAVLSDFEGGIWVGTDGGVSTYSGGSWNSFVDEFFFMTDKGVRSIITSMTEDPNRNLWFGLAGGGVVRYNEHDTTDVWWRYTIDDGLPYNYILSITADLQHSEIWCATMLGVARFVPEGNEGGVWHTYGLSNSTLPSNMVRCVVYNPIDSSIWFGTQYSGVTYISGDRRWQAPIVFPQPGTYPIDAIAFDENSTWFGTEAGILQYATNISVWRQYDSSTTNGLVPFGPVHAVTTNYTTTRWFGTNGGLLKLTDTLWTVMNRYNTLELPSDTVTALAYDIRGNLWIGTVNGVAVYNEEGTKF
jgi:ligand-binding sensor domain-containing protein